MLPASSLLGLLRNSITYYPLPITHYQKTKALFPLHNTNNKRKEL
jgi:hypothetical protein